MLCVFPAITTRGDLLFCRDDSRDGTGDVCKPRMIGRGGWETFHSVFAGADGAIYAISHDGDLLFYRDHTRDGTGDVHGSTGRLARIADSITILPSLACKSRTCPSPWLQLLGVAVGASSALFFLAAMASSMPSREAVTYCSTATTRVTAWATCTTQALLAVATGKYS